MQLSLELVFWIIGFFWLAALSFLYYRSQKRYQIFMKGSDALTLPALLESIAKGISENRNLMHELSQRVDELEKEGNLHIQKMGLLRFNPFRDTGGDQSFVLSLIDAHDTGVVISALYSRSGTRWYAKKVIKGKGEEHELSDEEQRAIQLAKKVKKP